VLFSVPPTAHTGARRHARGARPSENGKGRPQTRGCVLYVVFVDDSKTTARRQYLGELVAVGAVFVPEESLAPYAQDLVALRARLGIPADEELKWKPGKGTFLKDAGGDLVAELRRAMLQAAAERGIRSAVVIWDRLHRDWERAEIEPEILRYLYERIERFLREHQARGIVIADPPGGGGTEHNRWLSDARALAEAGTTYTTPDRVVLPMMTTPSHHAPHLQLADLVTAATTAAVAGHDPGLALVDLLKPLARTYNGVIGGAGVVLWPPDIKDLYHWVFGETHDHQGKPLCPPLINGRIAMIGRTFQTTDGMPKRGPQALASPP
jgi:hypothetical protein